MLNIVIIVTATLVTLFLSFSKKCSQSSTWKATVTPLASIMGSGFLVSAPLLAGIVGNNALFCMAALLVLAYLVGGAIRFNIKHFEPIESKKGSAQTVAFASRMVLSAAYFISVTYYLQLLAAFALQSFGKSDPFIAHLITTSLLCFIGGIGVWRGLSLLEKVEKYAVGFNLGMICALLLALFIYNLQLFQSGHWTLPKISSSIELKDLRVLIGLLIVVQGFETSRYLGESHSAEERIRTMKIAQRLSAVIYLVFIGLCTILFHSGLGADVTAIINLTRPVAPVLPTLLAVAAICSQFSAAVADTEGNGGLIEDLTKNRLPQKYAYLLILLVTVFITWETDVNQIIAYASRAFALYYSLQCAVAFLVAHQEAGIKNRTLKQTMFASLSVIGFLIFALGVPSGG